MTRIVALVFALLILSPLIVAALVSVAIATLLVLIIWWAPALVLLICGAARIAYLAARSSACGRQCPARAAGGRRPGSRAASGDGFTDALHGDVTLADVQRFGRPRDIEEALRETEFVLAGGWLLGHRVSGIIVDEWHFQIERQRGNWLRRLWGSLQNRISPPRYRFTFVPEDVQ